MVPSEPVTNSNIQQSKAKKKKKNKLTKNDVKPEFLMSPSHLSTTLLLLSTHTHKWFVFCCSSSIFFRTEKKTLSLGESPLPIFPLFPPFLPLDKRRSSRPSHLLFNPRSFCMPPYLLLLPSKVTLFALWIELLRCALLGASSTSDRSVSACFCQHVIK